MMSEDVRRSCDSAEDRNVLKVAVDFNNGPAQLKNLDLILPIEEVLEKFCREEGVTYEFGVTALWTSQKVFINDETQYVSDENKHLVTPGSFLILAPSPTVQIATLMERISDEEYFFREIDERSRDSILLHTLFTFDAHKAVFEILDEKWEPSSWATHGLSFVHRLYAKRLIRRIPMKIIAKMFESVSGAYSYPKELEHFVVQCLKILSCVRRLNRLHYNENIFKHLPNLLLNRDRPLVQEAALELLNYLVMYPKNVEEETVAVRYVVDQKIVGCICDHVLRGNPSKEMQQQLYRYQTLVMRPYWHKKVSKVLLTDPAMDEIRRLTHDAKGGRRTQLRRRLCSEPSRRESLSPMRPSKEKTPGLFLNLSKSFRRGRNRKTTAGKSESGPSNHPQTSNPLSRDQSLNNRPASTLTRMRKYYSCVIGDEVEEEKENGFSFNFYGPIEIPPASLVRQTNVSGMVKSASAAELHEPSSVMMLIREEEKFKKDPALSSKSIMTLTIDNLKYMARHYEESYRRWAVGRGQNTQFADSLTSAVCRVLEVGRPRPIDSPGDGYHPLIFFAFPHILEELFCEAFVLHEKTSKEMRAQGRRDEAKVFTVVQEQLSCALSSLGEDGTLNNKKPANLVELRDKLGWINYQLISEKRKREREERLHYDLRTKPLFLDYREKCRPSVITLIEKQRKNFMRNGQHLLKTNLKGEVQKHIQKYLGLNPKSDHLISGECTTKLEHCQHTKRIAIADITDVTSGKQSKLYWDTFNYNENRMIKLTPLDTEQWSCFFSLKMKDNEYLNFCAPDLKSLHYWMDGFNLLLGKSMNSPTMNAELDEFLDMEVRLHFLDVEGLPIPDEPPVVPPLPPNFNFVTGKKNTLRATIYQPQVEK